MLSALAAIIIVFLLGKPAVANLPVHNRSESTAFAVLGSACLTGAGNLTQTMKSLAAGETIRGMAPAQAIMQGLQESAVRRLKRLPRMALSLAAASCKGRMGRTQFISVPAGVGCLKRMISAVASGDVVGVLGEVTRPGLYPVGSGHACGWRWPRPAG